MEHTKHIWRAFLILAFLGIAMVCGRQFAVPESFGKAGHYRYDSLKEMMSRPVVHGGSKSCKEGCHDHEERFAQYAKGKHQTVSCETCHDPVTYHVKDGEKIADMNKHATFDLCAYCHRKVEGRPKTFPQIVFLDHLREQDVPLAGEIPEGICFKCHDVHDPAIE